jgi:hypothetical protein
MGLPVYRFPKGNLDMLEDSLRRGGFRVERKSAPGKFGSLISRDGVSRALVFDISEKKDPVPCFGVASGRRNPISALICWPADARHILQVKKHFLDLGAIPMVVENKKDA